MIKRNRQDKYGKLFSEFTLNKKERELNKDLYEKIYDHYKYKFNDSDFDIKIEKITLNKLSGKFKGFKSNSDLQFMGIVFGMFLTYSVQLISSGFSQKNSIVIGYFAAALITILVIREVNKSRWNEKEFIYNLSLQVLDDIEEEDICKQNKKVKNIN